MTLFLSFLPTPAILNVEADAEANIRAFQSIGIGGGEGGGGLELQQMAVY